MIRTITEHDGGADRTYDVCIVGAGPAGITLALELADRGRRVCLLEAGGEGYTEAAQRLLEGDVATGSYPPLRRTRMSGLGGSTQVWAGWCRPLEAVDFRPRPRFGSPGWPFDRDALMPYYRRAHELCGLAEPEYDPAVWSARLGRRSLVTDDGELVDRIFHVRASRFGTEHRSRLEAARSLDVLLHAPVMGIELDAGGNACGADVRLATGGGTVVRAREYVLAAGGIENARLLLLSASEPERAPGNARGLVGRFFTDHPYVNPGWLVLHGGPRRLDFYFPSPVADASRAAVRATLSLPTDLIEREGLPGSALFFHPRYEAASAFDSPAVRAFLELRDSLRSRAVPDTRWPLLRRSLSAPHHVAIAALRRLLVRDGPAIRWRVRMMFETAARAENRVELGEPRDALGRPLARLHWRIDDGEIGAMRRTLDLFDGTLRRSGIGHIEPSLADDPDAWRGALEGGKHQMSTTRMHRDPSQGVVDESGRVHGTRNLYVTGSSVFPSSGFANPTLTVVALALRLADRLGHV